MEIAIAVFFSSMSPGGKESHDILKRISLGPEDEPRCVKLQALAVYPHVLCKWFCFKRK